MSSYMTPLEPSHLIARRDQAAAPDHHCPLLFHIYEQQVKHIDGCGQATIKDI